MNTSWLKGIPKDAHQEYEDMFKESKRLRKHIISILRNKIEIADADDRKKSKYELPSWGLYQADSIGFRRALDEMIKILED